MLLCEFLDLKNRKNTLHNSKNRICSIFVITVSPTKALHTILGRHRCYTWSTSVLCLVDIDTILGRRRYYTWSTSIPYLVDVNTILGRRRYYTWSKSILYLVDVDTILGRSRYYTWSTSMQYLSTLILYLIDVDFHVY